MKLSGSLIYLKLSWKCSVMTFKCNNNVMRLSKSLSNKLFNRSLNTPGSQQRSPASRYSSRCWYCKVSATSRFGFGKRQQGVAHGPGGCQNESNVGHTSRPNVKYALPQSSSEQDMICPDMLMDRLQVNNNLRGLYLPGCIGGTRVMWLIDTGAA